MAVHTLAPLPEFELRGQDVQALDAVIPVYVPAVHAPQAAAEDPPVAALNVPVVHDRHTLDTLADVDAEYLPAEQGVHTESPALSPYVPAAHGVHALAPDKPYDPAAHDRHTPDELAPVVTEYVPAGQGVHTDKPALTLYVPVGQVVQITFWETTHAELAYDPAWQMVLLLQDKQ